METIPPSVLNSTASYRRQSFQSPEAVNLGASASCASSRIEPSIDTSSALP
jgi:hypothetical protein